MVKELSFMEGPSKTVFSNMSKLIYVCGFINYEIITTVFKQLFKNQFINLLEKPSNTQCKLPFSTDINKMSNTSSKESDIA